MGASPVGLNYYSLMLPSVLLTAMADDSIDFLADVTSDTVEGLKRHLAIPLTGMLNIQQYTTTFTTLQI
jgi:hypothetical protein